MIDSKEIVDNLSKMTRNNKIRWYITHISGPDIQYGSVYNITKDKWILFKMYCKPHINEYYLIIRMIKQSKVDIIYTPLMTLTSDSRIYGEFVEMLYYAIKYTGPKKLSSGNTVLKKFI